MNKLALTAIICVSIAIVLATGLIAYTEGFKDGVDFNRNKKYEVRTGEHYGTRPVIDYHKIRRDSVTRIIDSLNIQYRFQCDMEKKYLNAGWAVLPNTDLAQKDLNASIKYGKMADKTYAVMQKQIAARLQIDRQ